MAGLTGGQDLVDAVDAAASHGLGGFLGKERHVGGVIHVHEGTQVLQLEVGHARGLDNIVVVGNVDDAGLAGEGVHKQSADLLGLHALDDGVNVHQLAPGVVDQHHAVLHLGKGLAVDHAGGLRQQGSMDGDDVAFTIQRVQIHVLGVLANGVVLVHVVGQDAAAEAAEALDNGIADLAGAHNADGHGAQLAAHLALQGKVVVVGGGNVAIDASRVSSRNKASQVQQFCLEQEVDMPASNEEIREAKEDGVTIHCGWGPQEIIETNGKVSAIVFKKCVSVFNDEGKFAPVYDENTTVTVACDRVIFAIGQRSVWGDLLKGEDVKFNGPAIELNKVTFQSSVEDIFAGGDVYTGPKFAIDAIAQGKIAAESLHRYVHHGHMETGRNRWEFKPLDTADILVESYDRGPKQVEGVNDKVTDKFKNYVLTLTEEQIKKETSRCLGCGATIVDANKCIGCGICTTKCDFDAIKLHRDHPECSTMTVAEDKFKAIIPYQLKRVKNIILKKKVEH